MTRKATSARLHPAEGERSAARGYSAQYRIAAEMIYGGLIEGDLEWVRVADPEAGRVDDVQIGRTTRVDAYQIKWGEYEGRVTFRALLAREGPPNALQPSLLAQLSDGRTRLVQTRPDRAVHVHLVMRASASDADDVAGTGRHFQAFLRHAWAARETWGSELGKATMPDWSPAIEVLRNETGLDAEVFAAFAPCAHLHLGHRLTEPRPGDRASQRREADLDHLAAFLFRLVADERRTVEIDRAELVRRLGWARRLDLRFRHEFPVDDRAYQPIAGTVAEIETALKTANGGYLALVGTPGSGKSTTLTKMLRYRPGHRVIRYYAFVRGDTALGRGEAEAFLSDVTRAIEKSGVVAQGPGSTLPETRAELAELLGGQLAALHDDWRENGVKTLILVDGLDHVAREQRPEHSLVDVLPSPTEVPDGVLIVLGSQSIGLHGLPPRALAQLAEPGRTLTMRRLERRDVIEIATSSLPREALADVDLEALWRVSAGHPLALAYLLKRLALSPDGDARRSALDAAAPFVDTVEQDYLTYWNTLRNDAEVRDLLGLLCRLRGAIDLDFLAVLTSVAVLDRFIANAAYLFHQETADRWTFFHNSFRQYLLVVTGQDAFGRTDVARHASFHRRLAEARGAQPGMPLGWERMHHLQGAGEKKEILRLFTQAYFREQYMALRPLPEISEDVAACLKAAIAEDDRIAIIRALLIEQELGEREQAMEDVDLPWLMLAMAAPSDRAGAAIQGGTLTIPKATALAFAGEISGDDPILAHRLFDLAEPIALLNGSRPVEGSRDRQRLKAWARVAWLFHPAATLSRLVSQVRLHVAEQPVGDDPAGDATDAFGDGLAADLLSTAAAAALRAGADDVVAVLEATLVGSGNASAIVRVDRLRAELAIEGRRPRAEGQAALERVCKHVPPDVAEPHEAIAIALMLLRLGGARERMEAYVNSPSGILVRDINTMGSKTLGDVLPLFAQARVLRALGRPLDPITAVPDDARTRRHGAVLLQRMLVLIGTVRGEADIGARLQPEQVLRRLLPALRLYYRSWQDARDWTDWHGVQGRAEPYFDLILRTAYAHGEAALLVVLRSIMHDWTDSPAHYWPVQWRRAVLLSAHALDPDRDRTVIGLAALSHGGVRAGVHDMVSHHAGQLLAWLDLNESEHAHIELAAMLRNSFGIYHRDDDQYERWCGWAARVSATRPRDRADQALLPFLRGMVVIHGDRRGHDPEAAASALIGASAALDPGWARDLVCWLLANGGTSRHAALSGLLKGILHENASERTMRSALLAAARLVVPFEMTADRDLAIALGAAAHRAGGEARHIDEAQALLRAVATETYPRNRSTWSEGFALGIRAAGGDSPTGNTEPPEDQLGEPGEPPKSEGLAMADGTFVTLEIMQEKHRRPERFCALVAQAASAQALSWEPLLGIVLDGADGTSITAVCKAIAHLEPPLHVHAWFARRLAGVGRISDARAAVDRAWKASKPYGWHRHYDGGSRLTAAEATILVDSEQGRRRVLEVFVSDYLGESRHSGSLLRDLDQLVKLMFAEPPLEEIWSELAEHAAQLVEIAMPAAPEPPAPRAVAEDATGALVDLAFGDLVHPVREIEDAARRFLLDLLREPETHPSITDRVNARLASDDDADLESTLAFLCGALDIDPGWTGGLAEELVQLAATTKSAIASGYAGSILDVLGRESPARAQQLLPPIYALRLPPAAMPGIGPTGRPRRGQPLDDTDDPIELAGTLEAPMASLANVSEIPLRNLTSRLAALMLEVAPRSAWDRAAEKRIQHDLESAGLKIAYRRPRVAVAHLAFGRLVQELVDAGRITWPVPGLDPWLFAFDPKVSTLDTSARPAWIVPPLASEMNS